MSEENKKPTERKSAQKLSMRDFFILLVWKRNFGLHSVKRFQRLRANSIKMAI